MGIDREAVGGVGLRVTVDILNQLGCTGDQYDDCLEDCIRERVGLKLSIYGSEYSGDIDYVWLIPGETYLEMIDNLPTFITTLRDAGVDCSVKDLEIISEYYTY